MGSKRNRFIKVRVSPEELGEAQRRARNCNLDLSKWARVKMGMGHESMSLKEFMAHEDKTAEQILKKIRAFLGRESK